jgi:hypothetical protein
MALHLSIFKLAIGGLIATAALAASKTGAAACCSCRATPSILPAWATTCVNPLVQAARNLATRTDCPAPPHRAAGTR